MLSFMQQPPPPLQDFYTRTMSLAVLPSSPVTPYNTQHDFPATSPSPSKRPKLSLDTSSVAPTAFGKKATSLRLETLSATSPTVRNTFSNAHEQKGSRLRLTPLTTTFSDSPTTTTPSQIDPTTPDEPIRSIASSGSTSSISTIDSFTHDEIPYKLPFPHTSILKNGPLERRATQTTSFAQSKPMFPAAKKVGFRAPLTEEITTTRFTLRHSDIGASASTISTLDLNDAQRGEEVKGEEKKEVEVVEPQTGEKRESEDEGEEDGETYPTTPVAGRRKRHRQWRWTLGSAGSNDSSSDAQESSIEGSSDGEQKKVGS